MDCATPSSLSFEALLDGRGAADSELSADVKAASAREEILKLSRCSDVLFLFLLLLVLTDALSCWGDIAGGDATFVTVGRGT